MPRLKYYIVGSPWPQISNKLRELYYNVAQITKWVQSCGLMREKKNKSSWVPAFPQLLPYLLCFLFDRRNTPPHLLQCPSSDAGKCPALWLKLGSSFCLDFVFVDVVQRFKISLVIPLPSSIFDDISEGKPALHGLICDEPGA